MGERAKVELIKEGIIQFDKSTGITWYKKGDVFETPLTPFIYGRLGIYFKIVDVINATVAKPEKIVKEPVKMSIDDVEVEITEEDIKVEPEIIKEIEKPKEETAKKTRRRKKK